MIDYVFYIVKRITRERKEKLSKMEWKERKRRNKRMPIEGYEGQCPKLQLQIEKYGGKRRSPMTILER